MKVLMEDNKRWKKELLIFMKKWKKY
jgi:hypothetical protein